MSKDLDDEKFQALIGQVEESYRFADYLSRNSLVEKRATEAAERPLPPPHGFNVYFGRPPRENTVLSPSREHDLMESHDLDDFLDDAKLRREALEIAIRLHTAPGLPAPADHQMVIRVARDILAFLQEKEG